MLCEFIRFPVYTCNASSYEKETCMTFMTSRHVHDLYVLRIYAYEAYKCNDLSYRQGTCLTFLTSRQICYLNVL